MSSANGRRRATEYITVRFEHIPAELLAHQLVGAATCESAAALIELAQREGWHVDVERITCPLRIVWGVDDRVLTWPRARRATATACPTPTGSSSTASGTARSWTSRSRPRS